jgi:lactoylglutathione lyase
MTRKWTPDGDGRIWWCWLELGNAAIMLQSFAKKVLLPGQRKAKLAGAYPSACNAKTLWPFTKRSRVWDRREKAIRRKRDVSNVSARPGWYKLDFESFTDVPEETVFSESEHGRSG